MLAIPANLIGLCLGQTKRFAHAWKFTRTDGTVFRLCSHDRTLTIAGESYAPMGSPVPTATRREAGLRDNNKDLSGAIRSDAFKHEDLRSGAWDNCQLDEYVVDWRYSFAGILWASRYWLGKAVFDGESWLVECSGMIRWLSQRVGKNYERSCDVDRLGSTECGVNIASFTVSSVVVDGMLDGEKTRIIRATTGSLGSFSDAYFALGEVVFTSGSNNGLSGEIKTYTNATRDIELQLPMPFPVLPADTFNLIAGCDRRASTCLTKFSNRANFRGFEYIPGTDAVLRISPQT